ncbi:MAG: energy transducer TonB [Verrucomicrobiota bacterium]|nr:energy transducer TonB [Verrucomicrobiota bacterium]
MRSCLRLLGFVLSLAAAGVAKAQGPTPQFRPAVLGRGPDSLVNKIDAEDLLKRGQLDGAVMFSAIVAPNGAATSTWTYRRIPGSEALENEVDKRLQGIKFTPPIYQHQPVSVMLYGTVIFSAQDKPHIHVFLNQDPLEIQRASDFIGPQPVIGGDSKFKGVRAPDPDMPVSVSGIADLALKVSATGNPEKMDVVNEEPPLLGFKEMAMEDFAGAKFIPAFRDGDPTACDTVLPVCYKPVPQEGD